MRQDDAAEFISASLIRIHAFPSIRKRLVPIMSKAKVHLIDIVFAMHNEELNDKVALTAVRERIARTPQKILRIHK